MGPVTYWHWVSLPHATFALAVRGGVVVDGPPIARWTVGRDAAGVLAYFARRPGATVTRLPR